MSEDSQSPIIRFGRGLGAFIALVGGVVSGFFLTNLFLMARASGSWPTVPGEVTRAQVGETSVGRYRADVAYTYTVADHRYVGKRIRASDGEFGFRDGAEQAIEGLAPGQRVEVHYDPADPSRSVLRAGAEAQDYVLLLVPVVIFALGVRSVIWLRRTKRKKMLETDFQS